MEQHGVGVSTHNPHNSSKHELKFLTAWNSQRSVSMYQTSDPAVLTHGGFAGAWNSMSCG